MQIVLLGILHLLSDASLCGGNSDGMNFCNVLHKGFFSLKFSKKINHNFRNNPT
jgi:hypothetical protein